MKRSMMATVTLILLCWLPSTLLAQGVGGALRVGVLREVPLVIVFVHREQVTCNLFLLEERIYATAGRDPGAQHAVGQAAVAVLILGSLAPQDLQGLGRVAGV